MTGLAFGSLHALFAGPTQKTCRAFAPIAARRTFLPLNAVSVFFGIAPPVHMPRGIASQPRLAIVVQRIKEWVPTPGHRPTWRACSCAPVAIAFAERVVAADIAVIEGALHPQVTRNALASSAFESSIPFAAAVSRSLARPERLRRHARIVEGPPAIVNFPSRITVHETPERADAVSVVTAKIRPLEPWLARTKTAVFHEA